MHYADRRQISRTVDVKQSRSDLIFHCVKFPILRARDADSAKKKDADSPKKISSHHSDCNNTLMSIGQPIKLTNRRHV